MIDFDPTTRDKFAARALDTLAQLDANPEANRSTRQVAVAAAIDDAMAAGVAHFQASVNAGSCPRALPHDAACSVRVELRAAGFKIVRDRSRK